MRAPAASVQERPPARRVDQQARRVDRLQRLVRLGAARAAQQRLHARHELAHAERLGQVVVGADLERVHLVVLGAARRDDQDRDRDAVAPRLLGQRPAVDARQHEVDDGDVVLLVAELAQPLVAILGEHDVEPGVPQVRRNGTRDNAVVLDHEHAGHDRSVPRASVGTAGASSTLARVGGAETRARERGESSSVG